jgi:hypothetical protein
VAPTPLAAPTMTIEMDEAISAYSIAVVCRPNRQ